MGINTIEREIKMDLIYQNTFKNVGEIYYDHAQWKGQVNKFTINTHKII